MTKIKICGIKTLPNALAAIESGADMLGFNFYPKSPRYIDPAACAEITSVLREKHPGITLVGVFVNSPTDEIRAIFETAHLHLAQLHGDETSEILAELQPHAFKAIRLPQATTNPLESVHPFLSVDNPIHESVPNPLTTSVHPFSSVASPIRASVPNPLTTSVHPFESVDSPALLIDSSAPNLYGGSGLTADWDAAAQIARQYPILLAGGLTPENVTQAIARVQPWGVDTASGVESAPGVKDPAKMHAFVKAVRDT
jgi:phosphoribosylanthranilate isomerase